MSKVFMTTELLSFILSTTHSVSSGREKKNPRKKKTSTHTQKVFVGILFFLNYLRHFLLGILGLYPEERALFVFSRFTVETSCLQSVTLSTGPALLQVRYFLYQASSTMLKSTQQCVYISCLERNERKWLVFKQFYNGALLILEI